MSNKTFELTDTVLYKAKQILLSGTICDECLGRAFAKLGHGLSNAERGGSLRKALGIVQDYGESKACWVCGGEFQRVEEWAGQAHAISSGFEYNTYLFGVKLSPRIVQAEKLFLERFPTDTYEPLKHAFNREAGKAFEVHANPCTVDFNRPQVSFVIDLSTNCIDLKVRSLYIYGRYRKLVRGIPQTRWPCRKCGGKGCEACNFTGKQYKESVEELVADPFLKEAGSNEAYLHGAGREDIDARMMGKGRPFVLEVVSPHVRSIDLAQLSKQVDRSAKGKVEVSDLQFVTRDMVCLVKETRASKTYRASVSFAAPVEERRLDAGVSSLVGRISQRTPLRVSHRRADLVRLRRLIAAEVEQVFERGADLILCGEGGLYIKELVSGDQGRTTPSLSGVLGVEARVVKLDVIDVSHSAFPDSV